MKNLLVQLLGSTGVLLCRMAIRVGGGGHIEFEVKKVYRCPYNHYDCGQKKFPINKVYVGILLALAVFLLYTIADEIKLGCKNVVRIIAEDNQQEKEMFGGRLDGR